MPRCTKPSRAAGTASRRNRSQWTVRAAQRRRRLREAYCRIRMILVTGATGTVGGEVVRLLAARGQKVRAFGRNAERLPRLAGVEPFAGDLTDRFAVGAAVKGADRIFLLGEPDPDHVEEQSNVIQAARRNGIKLLVKMSALGADAQSPINLARWHAKTEDEL